MSWLQTFTAWEWFIFAGGLLLLELLVSGVFFFWFGIAAAVIGGIMFFWPEILGWDHQWLLFAALSGLLTILWRRYDSSVSRETDSPMLNQREQQYIGREFILEEPIVAGFGRVKVDDNWWKISGPDCDAGARIRFVKFDNMMYQVELVS